MKKIIFLTLFIILALGIWQNCQAVDLLLKYPVVGGQSLEKTSSLPQLINYIYKFALLACGITALVSILVGAVQYVTSAGDSSKAGDAKNRITSALLGILILLASVLILRTINPDLVNLKFGLPETKTTPTGYSCICTMSGPASGGPAQIYDVNAWINPNSSAVWGTSRCNKSFKSNQEAGTLCLQACKKLEGGLMGPKLSGTKLPKCN